MNRKSTGITVDRPFTALAFDFGLTKIGIAAGQTRTATATALTVIKARDGIPDWNRIEALIQEWQPAVLVVGLPLTLDGDPGAMAVRARKFSNRLNGRFQLPCHLMDERLSSVAAEELIRELGLRDSVDSVAARLILESWFQENSVT